MPSYYLIQLLGEDQSQHERAVGIVFTNNRQGYLLAWAFAVQADCRDGILISVSGEPLVWRHQITSRFNALAAGRHGGSLQRRDIEGTAASGLPLCSKNFISTGI